MNLQFVKKEKISDKKTFFSLAFFSLKKSFNPKGFTLIGVMVASAIGLIVVVGMSQMFTNMHSQLKQMEQKSALVFFNEYIGSQLGTNCKSTLQDWNALLTGTNFVFSQLKDENDRIILDVGNVREKERLEGEYGIKGHSSFQMKCSEEPETPDDPNDPDDCNCSSGPYPCNRTWNFNFISQTAVRGLPKYNRVMSFQVEVSYASSDPKDFQCDKITLGGSGVGLDDHDCIYLEGDLSLVGCGTTTNNIIQSNKTTAFGVNAGPSAGQGEHSVFIGYNTGTQTNDKNAINNTFLGYQAGRDNTKGGNNIFLGYNAGLKNIEGSRNTFIGSNAGKSITKGSQNTFIGYGAGENYNEPDWYKNPTNNTFLGHSAGSSITTGNHNIFLGGSAGRDITTGYSNLMIGNWAGAKANSGSRNIFIGHDAGRTTVGNDNIFIGFEAGDNGLYNSVNKFFIVGVGNDNKGKGPNKADWIVGRIGTDNIWVNDPANALSNSPGKRICLEDGTNCPATASAGTPAHTHAISSRTLKKNIKPFKNFKQPLKDLLITPLFTYQYKDKNHHPEKRRMGIISEELPEHLQIKVKDKPSFPDWPSIYGSFWAGIKALHKMFEDLQQEFSQGMKQLKTEVFLKFKNLDSQIVSLKNKLEKLIKEFTQFRTEFTNNKKQQNEEQKQLIQTKKELEILKEELKETKTKWNQTDLKLIETNKELSKTKQDISETKKEMLKLKKQLEETNKKAKQNQ